MIEPLLFFRYQLKHGRVDRHVVSADRLSLNVPDAELLQHTTTATITNTGDRIAVTQTAAAIAIQREAVAAPIAAMSSAVLPEVPVCTDTTLTHKDDMNEVAGVFMKLFYGSWQASKADAPDFPEISLREHIRFNN